MSELERIASRTEYEGKIVSVRVDELRYPDGSTAEREIVSHPGAVAVVAHDGERLYMVAQPREAVNEQRRISRLWGRLDVAS